MTYDYLFYGLALFAVVAFLGTLGGCFLVFSEEEGYYVDGTA